LRADKFLKFETICLFVKVTVVNLWQASELNLYYVVMSDTHPTLVFRKFNCKNKKITFSLASTDVLGFALWRKAYI